MWIRFPGVLSFFSENNRQEQCSSTFFVVVYLLQTFKKFSYAPQRAVLRIKRRK